MDSPLATKRLAVAIVVAAASAGALWASSSRLDARVDPVDTKLLTQPAISATHLAFIYARRPLRRRPRRRRQQRPAADDRRRDRVESGVLARREDDCVQRAVRRQHRRLHGAGRRRRAGAPDVASRRRHRPGLHARRQGACCSRRSARRSPTRYAQLFTVPVAGRHRGSAADPQRRRARPTRPTASASPTTRSPPRFLQWKQYRGGTASRLWLYNAKGHAVEKIPQPADARQRHRPDVDRRHRLLPLRPRRRVQPVRLRHEEQAGAAAHDARRLSRCSTASARAAAASSTNRPDVLHLLDPADRRRARRLTIGVASDLRETRPRFAKGARWIRDAALSPTGARAAFDFRGEIVTVPGEKGDVRNLTNSVGRARSLSGVVARRPLDRLVLRRDRRVPALHRQPGRQGRAARDQGARAKASTAIRSGRRTRRRSPTSTTRSRVYWVDVKSGVSKKIASQPIYGPVVVISYAWSPDSKWLAYAMDNQAYITTVYAHSIEQDKSFQVSDGLSDVSNPVFDKSGKYLFFLASTDAGPVKDWFAQSNADMRVDVGHLPRGAAERPGVAARAGERRGEAGRGREERRGEARRPEGRSQADRCRKTSRRPGRPAVPHRLRRPAVSHPRSADCRRRRSRTCRRAPPGRSTT